MLFQRLALSLLCVFMHLVMCVMVCLYVRMCLPVYVYVCVLTDCVNISVCAYVVV